MPLTALTLVSAVWFLLLAEGLREGRPADLT
jgi:hypothetical protein